MTSWLGAGRRVLGRLGRRAAAQLGRWDLWLRYLAWGGSGTPKDIDRHIRHGEVLDDHEHHLLVHALNEYAGQRLGRPVVRDGASAPYDQDAAG